MPWGPTAMPGDDWVESSSSFHPGGCQLRLRRRLGPLPQGHDQLAGRSRPRARPTPRASRSRNGDYTMNTAVIQIGSLSEADDPGRRRDHQRRPVLITPGRVRLVVEADDPPIAKGDHAAPTPAKPPCPSSRSPGRRGWGLFLDGVGFGRIFRFFSFSSPTVLVQSAESGVTVLDPTCSGGSGLDSDRDGPRHAMDGAPFDPPILSSSDQGFSSRSRTGTRLPRQRLSPDLPSRQPPSSGSTDSFGSSSVFDGTGHLRPGSRSARFANM